MTATAEGVWAPGGVGAVPSAGVSVGGGVYVLVGSASVGRGVGEGRLDRAGIAGSAASRAWRASTCVSSKAAPNVSATAPSSKTLLRQETSLGTIAVLSLLQPGRQNGQQNRKSAALRYFTLHPHPPSLGCHQTSHGRQTNPCLPQSGNQRLVSGQMGFKDVRAILWQNAFAAVPYC